MYTKADKPHWNTVFTLANPQQTAGDKTQGDWLDRRVEKKTVRNRLAIERSKTRTAVSECLPKNGNGSQYGSFPQDATNRSSLRHTKYVRAVYTRNLVKLQAKQVRIISYPWPSAARSVKYACAKPSSALSRLPGLHTKNFCYQHTKFNHSNTSWSSTLQ